MKHSLTPRIFMGYFEEPIASLLVRGDCRVGLADVVEIQLSIEVSVKLYYSTKIILIDSFSGIN